MTKLWLVAGHGNGDPGAVKNEYYESNLTRDFCSRLYNLCLENNLNVGLYDTNKNLYKSRNYEIFKSGDYVLEVHFNSHIDTTANGTEMFIHKKFKPDINDKTILNTFNEFFRIRNGGFVYVDNFQNCNYFASNNIGYSLLEICFMSNTNELNKYLNNSSKILSKMVENLKTLFDSKTEINNNKIASNEFKVKISINDLRIRSEPTTNSRIIGYIEKGVYTIVDTKGRWGKLKSGIGWIHLDYTTAI